MSKEMRQQIDRVKNWKQFLNESVNRNNDIKLGDKIIRGNINKDGFAVGNPKNIKEYRVIGLNPKVKLQQVLTKKGEQELGEIIEIDNTVVNILRLLPLTTFKDEPYTDTNLNYIWVGNF
jgi:hypothetical protein